MTKLLPTATLTYDADPMYADDPEAKAWFFDLLNNDELILHSNTLGDEVGTITISDMGIIDE